MGMVQAIQLFMHHMMIIVKYLKKMAFTWNTTPIAYKSTSRFNKLSLVRMMKTTRLLLLLLLLGNNNINNYGNT